MSKDRLFRLVAGLSLVAVLTAAVIGASAATMPSTAADLALLAGFLVVAGSVNVAVAVLAPGWPMTKHARSLRTKAMVSALQTALLPMATLIITAVLMFISSHDLALLLGLVGFSSGVAAFAAVAVSASLARDVEELNQGVERLSEGAFGCTVPVRSHDEIGRLAVSFNRVSKELRTSLDRQRELEQSRRELIAAVSHDLRTPLASIRAMVESITDGVVTDAATTSRYLSQTQHEVENLGQLIADLFELSQIDAHLLELHVEDAAVEDIVSDTVASMAPQADARQVKLTGSVTGHPRAAMDSRRVQRVLCNLIQNAIRHTPPDGSVMVIARDAGEELEVMVNDTGEGIVESDLSRLFDRSYRADPSRARASGGAGLGLTIARGIVEAHGGRIWATSKHGHGATFTFTLPHDFAMDESRDMVPSLG